eukprot:sb/3469696/
MIRLLLFTAAFCGTVVLTADWKAVKWMIPWDLEATPLQITTDSTLGSDEMIWVRMFDKDGSISGYVKVDFSSTMQYWIGYCSTSWTNLPVEPPLEVDKIWTITKTETALIIACNNVQVLNYLFADGLNKYCVKYWGGDVVEQIAFIGSGTASDFYKVDSGITVIPYMLLYVTTCKSLPAPKPHVKSRRALLSCSLSLTSCILIGCYLSHVRSHRLSWAVGLIT